MPIYAFRCETCGHDFDKLQKLSDPDPEVCPACGARTVKRQLTAPSFRLSGSGWYETDFKKDGDKKRNLTESKDGKAADGHAAATSESKSEKSGDGKPAGGNAEVKSGESKSSSAAKPESQSGAKADSKPATPPKPKPAAE